MTDKTITAAELFGTRLETGEDFREVQEAISPRFSEDDLALRFSVAYAGDLRYVPRWGRWLRYDGTRWREDEILKVFDRARTICRAASAELGEKEQSLAGRITAGATVAAVEKLARSDRRHAALAEQWDADAWALNTPTGTVDLRTGALRPHDPQDHITKTTTAGPGGDCTLWLQFLERVTGGDTELRAFLQRMVGYSLTGSTREHALFFLYGTGANGKSVFLSTISALLGDYSKTAAASSFTATHNEQHPTDLAGLRGARFVTAVETEDGARWAEAKIKSLTRGDRIAARFMRCDFFEFTPEFKLVIAGNHKPGLRSVDEAIRRRLHLIPFEVTIPEAERDTSLVEKLKAEYPGILQWAIDGCLSWQRDGLNPPAAVRSATEEYLAAEDAIGRWLDERCDLDRSYEFCSTSALFSDYEQWCERTGEKAGPQKRFSQAIEDRGFDRARTRRCKGFSGLGLLSDAKGAGSAT